MSPHLKTRGSVLIPSSAQEPVGKMHNWQQPPNLCLNVNKEEKAQKCQILHKITLVALIFLFNTYSSHYLVVLGCLKTRLSRKGLHVVALVSSCCRFY